MGNNVIALFVSRLRTTSTKNVSPGQSIERWFAVSQFLTTEINGTTSRRRLSGNIFSYKVL